MTAAVVLELTLRGVEVREDTIAFVRRCCRALSPRPSPAWDRVWVYLERRPDWREVRAHVRVEDGDDAWIARSEAADERLAIRCAFEVLSARLLLRPYARAAWCSA